ncbi:MAG: nicotinate (nicotinamide) nucleotide adenylyltransferase [Candidatus Fournierella pullistercoris]|uniref:Probable nicotinate-nucleotide adenylyltransferase n=1 Tax=Candidatus Allofournierella pullistercoris TaxID=2838597 RepID=A0A948T1E6_9FIRM|nr:nicotinate (nicotinamide) nucleotide adenylyltransferase [Candidatus Fournierella pullistercoris]
MKVLLFGGTFDPPHLGHVHLLQSAIQACQPDKVVVMPAGIPPHKSASKTPAKLRLAMCQCFAGLHLDLEISDWEIQQGGCSYTIDTVKMLQNRWPDAQIYLSIGSDMLTSFSSWKCWKELLQRVVLVVQSRYQGDDQALAQAADALVQEGGRVLFARQKVLPIASSDVRSGTLGMEVLPGEVQQIVQQYHLYKGEQA